MILCEYGCGQEAKYQFKNGKWCCSDFHSKCQAIKYKTTRDLSGSNNPMFGKKFTREHRKKLSQSKKGRRAWNKGINHTTETKNKISKKLKGISSHRKGKKLQIETRKKISENNGRGMLGRTHSEKTKKKIGSLIKGNTTWNKGTSGIYSKETRKKMSISQKFTISQFNKRHPFFSQIEELRYNPDKPGEKEIQVHCKYSGCKNSKENGGWFTPTRTQLPERIRQLEHPEGTGGSYFYCSVNCKNICPLFNLRSDPNQDIENHYIPGYEIFREEVLKRQLEEYGYNFCEYCDSEENLHVHHEKPQKTNPLFVLDPDNGVVLCQECHYIVGHKVGTECSTGNLSNIIC